MEPRALDGVGPEAFGEEEDVCRGEGGRRVVHGRRERGRALRGWQ